MDGNGVKLAGLAFLAFLLLEVGITGKLGSILGAFIDPANMQDGSGSSTASSSGSTGITTFQNGAGGYYNGSFPVQSSTDIMTLIGSIFGPYSSQAIKIAKAESSLNPGAVNAIPVSGSHATGLFQILYPSTWNTTLYASSDPKDPEANTKAAYEIFQRDGYSWREWSTAPALGLR